MKQVYAETPRVCWPDSHRRIEPMTPEREKKIMDEYERDMHTYIIHGNSIRAKSRKDAMKRYSKL